MNRGRNRVFGGCLVGGLVAASCWLFGGETFPSNGPSGAEEQPAHPLPPGMKAPVVDFPTSPSRRALTEL